MTKDNTNIIEQYLIKSSKEHSTEKTESIIDMLNEFESKDIISSDRKEYYMNILNYCDLIDSKYKKR